VERHKRFIIYPEDNIFILLLIINVIAFIYTVLYLPYDLAFNPNTTWTLIINQTMNGVFLIEIFMSLFTALISDNEIIDDYWTIWKNYAKTWLILDIVSVFPFEFLDSNLATLNIVGRILRVLRLTKIYKMISNFKRL
jgi:hypothetical protein